MRGTSPSRHWRGMACSAHVRDLQHNALRFGVLDWAAPPIVLLGLPVRLQHQALERVRCSATLDLFARGGGLARLIRRLSRCVGPARPCRYEQMMSALLCLPLGWLVYGDILPGLQRWDCCTGRCDRRPGTRAGCSFRLASGGCDGIREPREVWGWVVGKFDAYTKVIRNCWRLLGEGYIQSLCCPEPTEIGSYAVRLPRSNQLYSIYNRYDEGRQSNTPIIAFPKDPNAASS